jgi:hypothetical protein
MKLSSELSSETREGLIQKLKPEIENQIRGEF